MLRMKPAVSSVLLSLLVAGAPVALFADDAEAKLACEPNQASTQPCVIALPGLGTQPLVQTLPFDVPVFLAGKGPPELQRIVVHIFHAKQPFRVEPTCRDPLDPKTCTYTCYWQGATPEQAADDKSSWVRSDLEANVERIDCSAVPTAAEWRAAPFDPAEPPVDSSGEAAAEQSFQLRLPPFAPNEHFVLLIEDERRLDAEELARLRRRVAEAISADIDSLTPDASDQTLDAWLARLREAGCETLRQIAREEKLKLVSEEGSLFDCSTTGLGADSEAWRGDLRKLGEYLSQDVDLRSNLEGCADDHQDLEAALDDLRDHLEEVEVDTSRWRVLQHLRESSGRPSTLARGRWIGQGTDVNVPGGNPCDSEAIEEVVDGYTLLAQSLSEAKNEIGQNDATLVARLTKAQELAETLRGEAAAVHAGRGSVNLFAARIAASITNTNFLMGDTIGTFLTRQKGYLAADFGFAFAPELEVAVPYLGANIYLRPVNKNEPLSLWPLLRNPGKRFAFSLGVVLEKIDDNEVGPLFDDFSLLTGGGYRVTEALRLSGGVVWVRKKDQSPFDTPDSLAWSPYVSVSLDYDVSGLIEWFDDVFGGGG